MCVLFQECLLAIINDGILDRKEYQELKLKAETVQSMYPDTFDSKIAGNVISFLEKHSSTIKIKYIIPQNNKNKKRNIQFTFTPNYSEDDFITGSSTLEKISNISQGDNLAETKNDEHRCGAAAVLSAYLLLNPDSPEVSFKKLAGRIGFPTAHTGFTYKNVHMAQEKIYRYSNTDNLSGITSGYNIIYSTRTGIIDKIEHTGEIVNTAKYAGLKINPLTGSNKFSIDNKKKAVDDFFVKNPDGVLLVGLYFDKVTGDIYRPRSVNDQNHYVLIIKRKNKFFLINSGVTDNGKKEAVKELPSESVKMLIYDTPGNISALTL